MTFKISKYLYLRFKFSNFRNIFIKLTFIAKLGKECNTSAKKAIESKSRDVLQEIVK
jgi:hypothetical protein